MSWRVRIEETQFVLLNTFLDVAISRWHETFSFMMSLLAMSFGALETPWLALGGLFLSSYAQMGWETVLLHCWTPFPAVKLIFPVWTSGCRPRAMNIANSHTHTHTHTYTLIFILQVAIAEGRELSPGNTETLGRREVPSQPCFHHQWHSSCTHPLYVCSNSPLCCCFIFFAGLWFIWWVRLFPQKEEPCTTWASPVYPTLPQTSTSTGTKNKAKRGWERVSVHVDLLCVSRDPRWGRGQETPGEG